MTINQAAILAVAGLLVICVVWMFIESAMKGWPWKSRRGLVITEKPVPDSRDSIRAHKAILSGRVK